MQNSKLSIGETVSKSFSPIQWAQCACDTMMQKYKPAELPPERFHYHQGVFLSGMEKLWKETKKTEYYDYIKSWVDSHVMSDGNIIKYLSTEFDDIQPGVLLFNLLEETGDNRYQKALHTLVPLLKTWPTNPSGGFWHKDHHPNQMWLDSLYMIGPIASQFAETFGEDEYFDMMAYQAILMEQKTKDPISGLLYHGWDESKLEAWADPETGQAPEFWGRAVGWYPVALLEMLEYFPEDHKDKRTLINILQNVLKAIVKYQDPASGLWYQVIDKGDRPDNWLENSCTALFAQAIAKAVRLGYLESEYLPYAWKGYQGIIDTLTFDEENNLIIGHICIGTGIGDYAHYIARPTCENDLHGVGAFILMTVELSMAQPLE